MNRQEKYFESMCGSVFDRFSGNQVTVRQLIHGERRLQQPSKVFRSRRQLGEVTHWREKEQARLETSLRRHVDDLLELVTAYNPDAIES